MFQLTRPRGTRLSWCSNKSGIPCFNSRVRGGRDVRAREVILRRVVSTHASAGDATGVRATEFIPRESFNSRVRGGRDLNPMPKSASVTFQLTRPRGTRLCLVITGFELIVSTHASAGDATPAVEGLCRVSGFNSRVRGGRDMLLFLTRRTKNSFNSRVRGGRDIFSSVGSCSISVSTHASAGDATDDRRLCRFTSDVSTHASAGDATPKKEDKKNMKKFQLTRPRGTRRS